MLHQLLAQATTVSDATQGSVTYDFASASGSTLGDTVAATMAGSDLAAKASDALNQVNWATPSWDIFIVLFFVLTVFLYGVSLGRDRIIVIMMSIYMALAVVSNAPIISHLEGAFALKAATFVAVFLMLFFLVSRTSLGKIFGSLAAGKLWQVLLFSVLHVGLLVSITFSFLPPESTASLHHLTRTIFATELGRFFWVISPIVAMVFFAKDE